MEIDVELPKGKLKKALGPIDGAAIVVGAIIGAGIFRVPGLVGEHLPAPFLVILAWVAGGLISLVGALCYAELSAMFPKSGGDYLYVKHTYGEGTAFVLGWTKALVIQAGSIASVAFIFATYWKVFFPANQFVIKLIAVTSILFLTWINIRGVSVGKWVQNISTWPKVLALVAIVAVGLAVGKGDFGNFTQSFVSGKSPFELLSAFGMALIFVLWTYGGWSELPYAAEEVRDPGRNLPLSLVWGTSVTVFVYVLINLILIYYVPVNEMAASSVVVSEMMEAACGKIGGMLLAVLVLVSTFSALNSLILTTGRIPFALARDNLVFQKISEVHPKHRTPAVALMINGVWASVLVISGSFDKLISYTSVAAWFFYALVGLSLFILRWKLKYIQRPYKVWLYPVTPMIFVAVSFFLVINTVIRTPFESLFGIGIMLMGLPIFWMSKFLERTMR